MEYSQWAVKITHLYSELFNEESDHYIGVDALEEGENMTSFFHALATVAPNHLFNKITGEDKNNLEFNHIANQLCFQFMNSVD